MGQINIAEERAVGAPADVVYGLVADMREHHPNFLPPAFEDFRVVEGGVGAGTVFSFTLNAGGRKRSSTMRVDEPEPGRVMTESDTESSLVTTWTFTPQGETCRVAVVRKHVPSSTSSRVEVDSSCDEASVTASTRSARSAVTARAAAARSDTYKNVREPCSLAAT